MAQKNFADAMNQIVNGTNGLKSQINTKADKHSPNFTGTPTAVTADNETDSTQLATTEFCQNLIRRLVGSAPETLNTLVELATAINNDPTFAQTIVQALDGKLNKTDAANTYATKAELSNVSVDTTNLAKLNAANTFTATQRIKKGDLFIYTPNSGQNDFIRVGAGNGYMLFSLFTGNNLSVGDIALKQNECRIDIGASIFYFKPDGIYLGTTKITN